MVLLANYKMFLRGIDCLQIVTFLLMDMSTSQGMINYHFSKQQTCTRYGNASLLWKMTSRSILYCAYLCDKQNTGCVSFLFDHNSNECYGFRLGLQDHTDKMTSVYGAKYFELNGYSNITTWKLKIWTGTENGSGTNHQVIVSIYGTNGAILDKKLKDDGDEFENGKVDNYQFSGESIGIPLKIHIMLQTKVGGGNYPGWLLDKITLQNAAMTTYTAIANKWFELGDSETLMLKEICA